MRKKVDYRSAMAGFLLAALSITAKADAAAEKRDFQITATSMVQALMQWTEQSGLQLVLKIDGEADHLPSRPVVGTYTPTAALDLLLTGSGLSYEFANPRTISIRNANGRVESASDAAEAEDPARSQKRVELEEIVVTGTNIRGQAPVGSNLRQIEREEMERSGHVLLQDYLATETQVFQGISEDFSQALAGNFSGGSDIQLRGLGPGTTLTLINGHRVASGGSLGAFVDIAAIPVAAIERIDLLADGSSALYGSDAIGGVANIILREEMDGVETRGSFASYDGDANEYLGSIVAGTDWGGGSFIAGYQYYEREPLTWADRKYTATGGDLRPFGGSDLRINVSSGRGDAPGNILHPVTGLPAFAIPDQDGRNLTADQLIPGQVNHADSSYYTLQREQETHSVFGQINQDLGVVRLHADLFYAHRENLLFQNGGAATLRVPATNPFYVNPFGSSGVVRVEYDFADELGRVTRAAEAEAWISSVRMAVPLGERFELSVRGTHGESRDKWVRTNRVDTSAAHTALADTNPATSLNVFGNGTANNPATLDSIRDAPEFDAGRNQLTNVHALMDGTLFAWAAGEVKMALGAEYLREELDLDSNFTADPTASIRSSYSAFGELLVPLIAQAQEIPAVQSVTLSLAGRYDDYEDYGSTFNPKGALDWYMSDVVRLRGTWGSSFRAPPFARSNTDINEAFGLVQSVRDPLSASGFSQAIILVGVSPGLEPETSTAWTAGIDITPTPRVRFGATYYHISYEDKIEAPAEGFNVLTAEQLYVGTGVIARDPTPRQIADICESGVTGDCNVPIAAILDLRQRNIAKVTASGVDFDANATFPTGIGEFSLGGQVSLGIEYDQQVTVNAPIKERLDTVESPLRLKMRARVGWAKNNWNMYGAVNHAGGYRDEVTNRGVDRWTTIDLGIGYEINEGAGLLSGASTRLTATNVLNELPPFVDQRLGYDTANASLVGRVIRLQLSKKL